MAAIVGCGDGFQWNAPWISGFKRERRSVGILPVVLCACCLGTVGETPTGQPPRRRRYSRSLLRPNRYFITLLAACFEALIHGLRIFRRDGYLLVLLSELLVDEGDGVIARR